MQISISENRVLESAALIPVAVKVANEHGGRISLSNLLRHGNVPYGDGGRLIDTMNALRMLDRDPVPGAGWKLRAGVAS